MLDKDPVLEQGFRVEIGGFDMDPEYLQGFRVKIGF